MWIYQFKCILYVHSIKQSKNRVKERNKKYKYKTTIQKQEEKKVEKLFLKHNQKCLLKYTVIYSECECICVYVCVMRYKNAWGDT